MPFVQQAVPAAPPVQAVHIATGVGKTQRMIAQLAKYIHAGKALGPVLYAVPRHKLGEKIRQQFLDRGIDARIFRGRNADDPDFNPGKPMCLNLPAVELALKCHADISKTCCYKNKSTKCQFFNECGYQRQMPTKDNNPQVWIVASDMLFHAQPVLGKPHVLIIDEGFWAKGLRGIEQAVAVPLDSLKSTPKQRKKQPDQPSLFYRNIDRDFLRKALMSQPHDGPVELKYLQGLVERISPTHVILGDFATCISREWHNMPKPKLYPGMSKAAIERATKDKTMIAQSHHARSIIRIWGEINNMFISKIFVSGRLTLKTKGNGLRVVEWCGVEMIKEQFQVKTMLMDAMLPPLPILRIYHPQVEIVGDVRVAMPPPARYLIIGLVMQSIARRAN